jgi:uncharacterized protein (DUF2235 family)
LSSRNHHRILFNVFNLNSARTGALAAGRRRGYNAAMRQLILLCDGTNNNLSGGERDTHVVTLAERLGAAPDPDRLVFYDPGVGNPGELPGTTVWDKARRQFQRIEGLAFGRGVFDNIAEGYQFLMQHWHGEADQIWLFGFSRGAFTARSIGGMVNRFGILEPHMASMLPSLLQLYFSSGSARGDAITEQATRLFTETRRPCLHFVGVWDTVATVGSWPFTLRMKARPTLNGKRFVHVRHALALDEQRAQYVPRAYAEDNGATTLADGRAGTVQQQWFCGSHGDVGGGYRVADAALARAPLEWMLAEAASCGLRLPTAPVAPATPDTPLLHSQLKAMPLWALTGLAVRDTRRVVVDGGPDVPVVMAEHPSVAARNAPFPEHTVWQGAALPGGWWLHALFVGAWLLVLGQLLAGTQPALSWADAASRYLVANGEFQHWQLTAILSTEGRWWAELQAFHAPRWALVWDLGLIASYAYLLATLASRAFARAAGLNRLGRPVPRLLNLLGWALPLAVFADVAEDLASWATITFGDNELWLLAWLGRLAMATCSVAKWAGLLGVFVLVLGQRALARRG